MSFAPADFHNLLDPDLWVIEQILTLPSDPEPTITHTDGRVVVEFTDTVAMSQMQEAVTEYRSRILPVIFIIAQKVYAEFFRLLLDQCGSSAGDQQSAVEKTLTGLLSSGQVNTFRPFQDAKDFKRWWSGQYDYRTLRFSRNQIVHGTYSFTAGRLTVSDGKGAVLLDWTEADILSFASGVLQLSKSI